MNHKKNKTGQITAWLITWEWEGDHAKRADKIAAILNWRLTSAKISKIIEILYINASQTYKDRIDFAKNNNQGPYVATYDDINGIPWGGRIFCGHNPCLEARLVDNLCIIKDSIGNEKLSWEERQRPNLSWINNKK